jgi:hypothetical protein
VPHPRKIIGLGIICLVLSASGLLLADRRDQKAADFYSDARKSIEKKDYKKGIELLLKALERGATEPNEVQGSQTRYLVYKYDPYYEKAQVYFEQSEKYGVIKGWDLYKDLQARKATLETRLAASVPQIPPTPVRIVIAQPTPTAVLVAHAAPTATPPARSAGPPPTAATQLVQVAARDIEEVKKLSALVGTWSSLPGLAPEQLAALGKKRTRLDELVAFAQSGKADVQWGQAVLIERAILFDQLRPSLRRTYVEKGLIALSKRDWTGIEASAGSIERLDPQAHHADLFRFLSAGTRYLLGEKRDAALLESARRAHAGWLQKSGPGKSLPPMVSPALKALIPS